MQESEHYVQGRYTKNTDFESRTLCVELQLKNLAFEM